MATDITTIVKQGTYYYIDFTDEQLEKLGISAGDKFTFKETENGFLLEPYGTIEIDLDEMPLEVLHLLMQKSAEEDISVNKVIENILIETIGKYE